ncbi:TetR/AcrR family transcriptional regulator [Streptomyces sp. NPDC002755]|uniref:TetR/AcrR family transcriptional regulator n=1 Tax=Streptomyces sp. NPDC002884 TaxID=3154544 RepID=UPI0033239BEA
MSEALEAEERAAALDSLGGVLGEAGAAALDGPREQLAGSLLRAAFVLWEDPQVRPKLLGILKAAVNGKEGAEQMRGFLASQLFAEAGKAIGIAGMDIYQAAETLKVPAININAAAGQVWGVVLLRYVVELEPIASASSEELIDLLTPTIQRYLG